MGDRLAQDYATLRQAGRLALDERRLDDAAATFAKLKNMFPQQHGGIAGEAQLAQARGEWQTAISLFDECLARFPIAARAGWLSAKAACLAQLGQTDAAIAILTELAESDGADFKPLVALAGLLARAGRFDDAVQAWNRVIPQAPGPVRTEWLVGRARALDSAGRSDEAIEAWRAVAAQDPEHPIAGLRYLHSLGRLNPPDAALNEIRQGLFRHSTRYEIRLTGARFGLRANEIGYLRDVLPGLIADARNAADCAALFPLIAPAFEGWDQTTSWLALEHRLHNILPSAKPADLPTAQVVAMRIRLALRDHPGFLKLFDQQPAEPDPHWSRKFTRLAQILRTIPLPDHNAAKVFAIGLSKTGTTSLAGALDQLGYLTGHYRNEFTHDLLTPEDAFYHDALADTPICPYFEALFHMFPNSRFIYTTRPMQEWLSSYNRHHQRYARTSESEKLRALATTPGAGPYSARLGRHEVALFYQHGSPEAGRLAFEARVQAFFTGERANRLLIFDTFAGDGWDKLCGFLDRPVPAAPYPYRNIGQD